MTEFSKADVPEVLEGAVPQGVVKAERTYLEIPQDEIPDQYVPGRPAKEAEHIIAPDVRISVVWDQRPLMEAINEAITTNDINKVIAIFKGATIQATQTGPKLVRAICLPPR